MFVSSTNTICHSVLSWNAIFGVFSAVEQNVYINFHDLWMIQIKMLSLLIIECLQIKKKYISVKALGHQLIIQKSNITAAMKMPFIVGSAYPVSRIS